jgi:hypothetical protein
VCPAGNINSECSLTRTQEGLLPIMKKRIFLDQCRYDPIAGFAR